MPQYNAEDLAEVKKAIDRGGAHLRKGIEITGRLWKGGDPRLKTVPQERIAEAFREFHWAEDTYSSHHEFKDILNFGDRWARATHQAGVLYETIHGANAALNFVSAIDHAVKDKALYEVEWAKFCERYKDDPEFRKRWSIPAMPTSHSSIPISPSPILEHCEIRANSVGFDGFEFIAEVWGGPDGSYIVARTPRFRPFKPNLLRTLLPILDLGGHDTTSPDDRPWQRKFFNELVDHLVRTGWNPLPDSGMKWYNRRFERSGSLYAPDPDPRSLPYTISDLEERLKKVQRLLNQYQRRRDMKSYRKLAEGLMQLGIALERKRQFEEASKTYLQAAACFEQIPLAEAAAKAHDSAERVLELHYRFVNGEEG